MILCNKPGIAQHVKPGRPELPGSLSLFMCQESNLMNVGAEELAGLLDSIILIWHEQVRMLQFHACLWAIVASCKCDVRYCLQQAARRGE